jgi:hypothetical protein
MRGHHVYYAPGLEEAARWYWGMALRGKDFHPEDDPHDIVTQDDTGEYVPVFTGPEAVEVRNHMDEFWDACEDSGVDPCFMALVIAEHAKPGVEFDLDQIADWMEARVSA